MEEREREEEKNIRSITKDQEYKKFPRGTTRGYKKISNFWVHGFRQWHPHSKW